MSTINNTIISIDYDDTSVFDETDVYHGLDVYDGDVVVVTQIGMKNHIE